MKRLLALLSLLPSLGSCTLENDYYYYDRYYEPAPRPFYYHSAPAPRAYHHYHHHENRESHYHGHGSVMPESRVHEHPGNYGNGYVYGHDSVEEGHMHGHD